LIPGVVGRDLNNDTDAEDDIPENDRSTATECICDWSSHDGANQSTDGEKTDDQSGAIVREGAVSRSALVAESVQEVFHFEKTRDLTGVVTKDHPADRDDKDHGEDARSEHAYGAIILLLGV